MLGHTQSHQHQCPLRQGHSDGMWWTRREIATDTKIYFLSIQKWYVSKNTLNVCYHWAQQRQCALFLLTQCVPNAATLSLKYKIIPGNILLVMPLVRREQCCATEQQRLGLYQSCWKVSGWTENNLFERGKADCLNSLHVSNRQPQCCLFLDIPLKRLVAASTQRGTGLRLQEERRKGKEEEEEENGGD